MEMNDTLDGATGSPRLYRCDWPDGDVSFVLANSAEQAISRLDEVGAAEEYMLAEVDTFQVHFALTHRPTENAAGEDAPPWKFELEDFGDLTHEYMDVEKAVARKERLALGAPAGHEAKGNAAPELREPGPFDRHKPFVKMNDIEYRNAWDSLERGPHSLLGGMLDLARRAPPRTTVQTSVVVLVRPNGDERLLYGASEYGDAEGRGAAASCLRYCAWLGSLVPGERLERILLTTSLTHLTTTRKEDPLLDSEGHDWIEMEGEDLGEWHTHLVVESKATWVARILAARRKAQMALVSVGMLSLPDGSQRCFTESAELGDNAGRIFVADNIRTARRVGLLRENESLARHMLEIDLPSLRTAMNPDPLREGGRTRR